MKKYIYWSLFILFVVGSIMTGSPFNLIDAIVVRPIINILFVIFNLIHDFGLAIIIFTIIVKLAMWPLMKRQLNQTKLIRKIQPELTQIKKNCKGNKQMESLQTMDLYKRYNVKPFASILTILVQLPIFIAIFLAIRIVAAPTPQDNLMTRSYDIVAYEGSEVQELKEKQEVYWATKQQMPSGKSKKKKKFRDLIKDAKEGKEIDESEISTMTTGQMATMMPIMMFIIMFNIDGALAFYYFLSNVITVIQQRIVLNKVDDEIDAATDKAVLKELSKIKEAEVVENKKTGTKIKRISARDVKKKRR